MFRNFMQGSDISLSEHLEMYKKTQFIEYEYFQLVNYKVINLSLTLLRASIFVKHSFRKKEILPSSIYHNAVQSAIFIRETSSDSFQNILSITPSPVKRVVCPMQPSWKTKSEYHSVHRLRAKWYSGFPLIYRHFYGSSRAPELWISLGHIN